MIRAGVVFVVTCYSNKAQRNWDSERNHVAGMINIVRHTCSRMRSVDHRALLLPGRNVLLLKHTHKMPFPEQMTISSLLKGLN